MTWTTGKPTVPGWYWWRLGPGLLEQVVEFNGDNADERDAQWAGPLEPPSEAQ